MSISSKINQEFYYEYINHVELLEQVSYSMLGVQVEPAEVSGALDTLSRSHSDWMLQADAFHAEAMEATRK